jgi:hypothetical protein
LVCRLIAYHGRYVVFIIAPPVQRALHPSGNTEEGFALDVTAAIWKEFAIWPDELRVRDKFGSVRALFAAAILNSLSVTTRLATALRESTQLPPAIGNGVTSFLRSPFGARLVDLPAILAAPWEQMPQPINPPTA